MPETAQLLQPQGRWPEDISLWRLDMLLAFEARIAACYAALDTVERERADRYRVVGERVRYVITRATLRHLLSAQVGVPAASLQFTTVRNGRPTLVGYPALSFNVSHAGDHALIAMSHHRVVGVDIEHIDPHTDWHALVDMVCSSNQRKQLHVEAKTPGTAREGHDDRGGYGDSSRSGNGNGNVDVDVDVDADRDRDRDRDRHISEARNRDGGTPTFIAQQRRRFFQCWTAKEAILKALGVGLTDHLGLIDFSLDNDGVQRPCLHPAIAAQSMGGRGDGLAANEVANLSFHWLTDIDGYMGCIAYSDARPYVAARTAVR